MNEKELYEEQMAQLKEAARIFLKPMERLPFPVVVEAMTDHVILPMSDNAYDKSLLNLLADSCTATVAESVCEPFKANRPNDVSVQVEKRLQAHLEHNNISVEIPRAGNRRSGGGYPDRLLWLQQKPSYLEVKVSREQNMDMGSARNFFYQPTKNSKIQHTARHLLTGFAIREQAEKSWILSKWKIVDLFLLKVKLKPEYNADNLGIYRKEMILMEGDVKGIKVVP